MSCRARWSSTAVTLRRPRGRPVDRLRQDLAAVHPGELAGPQRPAQPGVPGVGADFGGHLWAEVVAQDRGVAAPVLAAGQVGPDPGQGKRVGVGERPLERLGRR